jgi:alpha-galactosidase
MLQVGDIGLSITEQYSHYALWVIMASPLLMGTDVSMLTNTSLTILGNTEVTTVNQSDCTDCLTPS